MSIDIDYNHSMQMDAINPPVDTVDAKTNVSQTEYMFNTTVQTELGELIPLTAEFYQTPYNQLRRSKIMLFISCFMNYSMYKNLKYSEQLAFVQKIEKSCLNTALEKAEQENIKTSWRNDLFCEIYHQICSKLASNIDKNNIVNNPTFAQLILNHGIPLQQLPRLSSQEIYPQKYTSIMYKLELSKNIQQTTRTSSMYRCGKCHKNQTHIENLYNRSLDEGVNLSITCINCGHRWNA